MSGISTNAIYPSGHAAKSSLWSVTNPFLLRRLERIPTKAGREGSPYLAADFSAISYTVKETRRGREFIVAGYSAQGLTPSAVIYDQLQGWPDDRRGYNFKQMLPAGAVPDVGAKYSVSHTFTLADTGALWTPSPFEIDILGSPTSVGEEDPGGGGGSGSGTSDLLFAQTAIVPVNGTNTETSGIGSGVGSMTIAANSQVPGDTFDFSADGFYSTDATTEPTMTWRFKIASDLTLTVTRQLPPAQSLQTWRARGKVRRSTTGASGVVTASMDLIVMYAGGFLLGGDSTTSATIVSTAVAKLAAFTLQWGTSSGTADADNQASVIGFDLRKTRVAT